MRRMGVYERFRGWGLGTLVLLLLLLLVGSTACQNVEMEGAQGITDALGREVQFSAPPQRIVIAGRANFMLSDALYLFPEAPERVLSLTKASQAANAFVQVLDPDAKAKTRFMADASAEELAAVQPDLVLLKSYMKDPLGDSLEQLGIPVVYLDLETPEQYARDLKTLGQLMDNPKRAQAIWDYYSDVLARVTQGTEDLDDVDKPRVLLLQYTDKGGEVAFKVPPATWIQTQMVTLAGGVPIWTEAAQGGGWVVVNFEQIAAWNPDQIYLINYFGNAADVVRALESDPQWSELDAVREEQLIPFIGDFHSWDQPDPRWGLGLLWLAKHMHPARFADMDIQAEMYHFFETYYGLDRATIETKIVPLMTP